MRGPRNSQTLPWQPTTPLRGWQSWWSSFFSVSCDASVAVASHHAFRSPCHRPLKGVGGSSSSRWCSASSFSHALSLSLSLLPTLSFSLSLCLLSAFLPPSLYFQYLYLPGGSLPDKKLKPAAAGILEALCSSSKHPESKGIYLK